MTLRSSSRSRQWGVWSVSALVAAVAYVVIVRVACGCDVNAFFGVEQQRVLLPILAVLGVVIYETRWDGVKREESDEAPLPDVSVDEVPVVRTIDAPRVVPVCEQLPKTEDVRPSSPQESMPGAVEYAAARQMPHHLIPDYLSDSDRQYLDLLGRSAACGYPKALAKFGEYALRRQVWVEAYYWMWRARKAGLKNLEPTLKGIRLSWATDGYPRESGNVYRMFSEEDGSVGRALLSLDSGRDVASAKAFLKTHHPDFLNSFT